jgi:putative Ca2+/H+ antiporter (TMEM165/GDT1 family)
MGIALDFKIFATVFVTIFLAEVGDKTQLATLLYASQNPHAKWLVFVAAAGALVLAAAIGVLAGAWVSQHVGERPLRLVAGLGFVAIGMWTMFGVWNGR